MLIETFGCVNRFWDYYFKNSKNDYYKSEFICICITNKLRKTGNTIA